MVVVDFDYDDFRRLLDLPKDKVVDGLTEIGAPSEVNSETGKIYAELTPNRPDWYSMEGLARALRSYYKKENGKYAAKKSAYKVMVDESVAKIRPYTACAVVKNLKFDDRRIRDVVLLQEKLLYTLGRKVKRFGIGIYPLKEIGFPLRYTTMKPEEIVYTPLNYPKEADAREILREHPKGKEYGHIIEKYGRYPVFVDKNDRIMALIPIVNSAETGKVDTDTEEVFVEVSGNDKVGINQALNIIACSLADMGGEIYEVEVAYKGKSDRCPDLTYKKMKFDVEKAEKLLGVKLEKKKIAECLGRMGYGGDGKIILVPPYRADVMDAVDIIEDLAIAYGYNNFEPTLPGFFSPGGRMTRDDAVDSVMRGMGFLEVKTFTLTNKKKLGGVGYGGKALEIKNPSSEDYTVVRPMLAADMLEVFAVNKMRGLPQKFYELGMVYENGKMKRNLCFGICNRNLEFSDALGYLQTLLGEQGLKYALKEKETGFCELPCSAAVVIEGKERGVFGKISSGVAGTFGLEFPVFICELALE
ncbi:phenylalanine--tRNA ligase subunit beta [Candidatus Micrarchaeota archaeon]|nr:phenylalanine--tRNA ligase subunit beta [Candidatus Micrarchaeota archaeon]